MQVSGSWLGLDGRSAQKICGASNRHANNHNNFASSKRSSSMCGTEGTKRDDIFEPNMALNDFSVKPVSGSGVTDQKTWSPKRQLGGRIRKQWGPIICGVGSGF